MFISAVNFQGLIRKYPEINQIFVQELAKEIANLTSQLHFEQERQTILRSYLIAMGDNSLIRV